MITYRSATPYDVSKASNLWRKMVNEINPSFSPNLDWWIIDTLEFLRHNNYAMMIAEDDGEMVAFTDGYIYNEPAQGKHAFYSRHSYVEPKYRHTDVIKTMYSILTQWCQSQSVDLLIFGCNDVTRSYWESKGYRLLEYMMAGDIHDI
jgi:GNAT superfamily N-acetyltransferase